MRGRSTSLALIAAGAVGLLAYFVIEPWITASRMTWPAIPHPGRVVSDAEALVAAYSNQIAIPESEWPDSIKAFRPRCLYKANGYLLAIISTGGINPGCGYAIYADGRTNRPVPAYRPDDVAVHPGIFRVRHIE